MALGEEPGVGTVMISGPQYRKLMQTYQETGNIPARAVEILGMFFQKQSM
jgi:hypothetical protein